MRIQEDFSVRFTGTRGLFPLQRTPFFVFTDFPWQTGVANAGMAEHVVFDFNLQAVYAAPYFVPHHQTLPGYGYGETQLDLPYVVWTNNGGLAPQFRTNNPLGFLEVAVSSANGRDVLDMAAAGACQGVTFLWSRADIDEGAGDPISQRFMTFRVGVGTGEDELLYSVRFEGVNTIRLATKEYGGQWVDREVIASSSDVWKAGALGNNLDDAPLEMNVIEFRLIAGRMAIRIGCQDQASYFEEARCDALGNPLWQINSITIRARGFKALACSAHPMKWRSAVEWTSAESPIGFSSNSFGVPFADPAGPVPEGCDFYVDLDRSYLAGPMVYYTASLVSAVSGTYRDVDYSDWTGAVRAVEWVYYGETSYNPEAGHIVQPEWIEIEHTFVPDSLEVVASARLGFNNSKKQLLPFGYFGTWGQWLRDHGQVGLEIWGRRTVAEGIYGPLELQFTGYGNTQGSAGGQAGVNGAVIACQGRRRQLKSPRWALPWMDGWNVFYAVAFLAQLGGVPISNMRFASLVPSVPFGEGSDLGDGHGNPAYYLPVGDAGSALSRPTSSDLWDLMVRIAASIGYMLFFDAAGYLVFDKFLPPRGIKRYFYESDVEAGGPQGCWSIESLKDMDEVRSDAILIGVDAFSPRWDPIVVKFTDQGVVDDERAFNHLGYPNPAAWIDSLFAESGFAWDAGLAMFSALRMPGYGVTFTTWYQPDIFPLDGVMVQSDKAGCSGVRMMVVQVQHRATKELTISKITARFIPS